MPPIWASISTVRSTMARTSLGSCLLVPFRRLTDRSASSVRPLRTSQYGDSGAKKMMTIRGVLHASIEARLEFDSRKNPLQRLDASAAPPVGNVVHTRLLLKLTRGLHKVSVPLEYPARTGATHIR